MASGRKLKILCLHGYRQNAENFKDKTGGFRKSLRNIADLVYIDAPSMIKENEHIPQTTSGKEGRSWWFCEESDQFNAKTECKNVNRFTESVETISVAFQTQGPFDGILGFSQGASLVSLICGLKELKVFCHDFQFVVIISGFRSISQCHQHLYQKPFDIQSLHIIGNSDSCIPKDLSEDLASLFRNSTVIYHDGGHFVPTHSNVRSRYVPFFKKILDNFVNKDLPILL